MRHAVTLLALIAVVVSLVVLQDARRGLTIESFAVGQTPVTRYARQGADGPVVVVAHGFAGSRQMLQGYSLPLAQAGYRVFAFDFQGHGRNPVPMSGDVTALDGTTQRLVDQTAAVIDAVANGGPVALLGHSMATDVLVRVARGRDDIGPVVLLSAFSQAIDATHPKDLLLVTGAGEPGLKGFAVEAAQMVDPGAVAGETVTAGDVTRRAVIAPWVEHVSILHSRRGRAEAVAWIDRAYGRTSDVAIRHTGWAILGLLGGIVALFGAVARVLPVTPVAAMPPTLALSQRRLAVVTLVPVVVAPVVSVLVDPQGLPVLVAGYLALHLAVFGLLQLWLIRRWGGRWGAFSPLAFVLLLGWSVVFGVALDRYAANFWPVAQRVWIIAAMALGAVPFMLADALLTHGASLRRRFVLRGGFILSLGIAVALNPFELFFLVMIAPVVLLFYAVFGTMGRMAGRRAGPLAAGLALGLVLAWALGVSFPLFRA
ncbi:Serine aminopeptidase, S33 [Loktanella atrilutea]|uniref:Serine aminopeptidase, S33 n=1 Tax=Loktanella atrilutea TaxID=366533 RepID=A0A1M5BHH6_LOKAT|nr:alpha/beta fold hydrolase [Loktanella atrilutea]SHF41879.1 Serine aminopeptidase, S33 [Loktanella atrilutea]